MVKKSIVISFICIALVSLTLVNIKAEDEDMSGLSIDEAIAEVDKFLSDISSKTDAEIERYRRKIEEDPNNASNYYNIGVLYFMQYKQKEEKGEYLRLAEKNWGQAILLDPKLKDEIMRIKEAGNTMDSFEEVRMEMKNSRKVIHLLNSGKKNLEEGRKLNDEKLVEEAVSNLKQAIEADNTIALSYKLLGDAYSWLYENNNIDEYLEKAEGAWDEAVKRDPSFESFKRRESSNVDRESENLSRVRRVWMNFYEIKNGQRPETELISLIESLNKMVDDNKSFAPAYFLLAEIYDFSQDKVKERDTYERVLANCPLERDVLFEVGRFYLKEEQYETARRFFEQILEEYPNDEKAMDCLEMVESGEEFEKELMEEIESSLK